MRFPLEIFQAVREVVPANIPVGVRLSATDWIEGGWDIDQSITFCKAQENLGCSFAHVSSGGLSPLQQIPLGPGYQMPLASEVHRHVRMPVFGVGLITDPEQAEAIISDGKADAVAFARAMLYNPRWPWHAAAKLGAQVISPHQYWRPQPATHKSLFGTTRMGQR